ncbi:TPM domain-containing protein [Archangium lansingense]|uniref:TPM domain-containing protein n=1 Tax=Archangium lansingense TaxID=2995310 RepID=A0ABT4ACD1_9BACT|nr:TPM domain-containing protein [Archangium lansinium]MCY1078564.1 TPM domain-containing protein [Archangium lansinium]
MVKASALFLLLPSLLLAAVPPTIERPVTDTQRLLSPAQTETVASELVRLREETGVQMAVLIVGTTEGEPIEDYAMQVFREWKGGQQGVDNGLLYVLAVKDRRMRLEVGYGLEEHLPDGAVRLLLDAQGPLMREQNYTGALVNIIHGVRERLPASAATKPQAPAAASSVSSSEPRDQREFLSVAVGGMAAYGLCLLLFIVLRPGLSAWMGNRVTFGLSGISIVLALLFINFCIERGNERVGGLNIWSLVWSFCVYCALMFVGRFLVLSDGWERWGICLIVGLLLGSPFTWVLVDEARWVLFFDILIPTFFATLFVAFFSIFPLFGHLLRAFVYVCGGASTFSSFSKEESTTYSSEPPPTERPKPSSSYLTPGRSSRTSSRSSSSSRRPSRPSRSVSASRSSSSDEDSSSSRSSSSDSPSVFASLWSSSSSSSSDSSSSSSSWSSSSSDSSSSSLSSDSSSSSSSSDWSGGGGDSGGGGASSSW